jgi:dTDP-4-dehydrorhamnose reductase
MIILLGASGYVGQAYQRFFVERGIPFFPASRAREHYATKEGLRTLISQVKPSFLINAAGYTGKPNVDACEANRTECLQGNVILPGLLREVCSEMKMPWGHISSGCIYTGSRPDGGGFCEKDAPNFSFRQDNCSFYSGTKALGEDILADAPECYLWRLRIPFNEIDHPRNYLTKMMTYSRLLEVRNSISQLDEFVCATWESWNRRIPFGIYNVTNSGSITTREIVTLITTSVASNRLVARNKTFCFFANEEEFISEVVKAPRSHCLLDNGKLRRCGIELTEVHEAVEMALAKWKERS